jgi:hypothetical protein
MGASWVLPEPHSLHLRNLCAPWLYLLASDQSRTKEEGYFRGIHTLV